MPAAATARGSFAELFASAWRQRAILGMLLATTGLATFWAVTIAGQDLARQMLIAHGATLDEARAPANLAYSIVETAGGGLGLLAFGPLAAWWGRRRAFWAYQLGAVLVVPIVCYVPTTYGQLLAMLPFYGFFTLGMHAGFAVYFPELFPTALRAGRLLLQWRPIGDVVGAAVLRVAEIGGRVAARPDAACACSCRGW